MAADDILPPNTNAPVATNAGGTSSWVSSHKGIVIGVALVAAVGIYFLFIKKKSTTTSKTSKTVLVSATPSLVAPTYSPSSKTVASSTGITGSALSQQLAAQAASQNASLSAAFATLRTSIDKAIAGITATKNPGGFTIHTTQGPDPYIPSGHVQPGGSVKRVPTGQVLQTSSLKIIGTGYAYVPGGKRSTGSVALSTGARYNTIYSYTMTMTDFKNNIPVDIIGTTGHPRQINMTQFKAIEATKKNQTTTWSPVLT